jgi:hypothetical protein
MRNRRALRPELFSGQRQVSKVDHFRDPLVALYKHIDCAALAAEMYPVALRRDSLQGGPPPYPPISMFRIRLVKRLHYPLDERVELRLCGQWRFLKARLWAARPASR